MNEILTQERLLRADEASQYLQISEGTLAVWRTNKRYQLPYVKCGRLIRYKLSDLRTWLENRTKNSSADVTNVTV